MKFESRTKFERKFERKVKPLSSKDGRIAAALIAQAQRYTATEYGHSRWDAFQTCETVHHLRHHLRVRPKIHARAPDIGTVVHIGLAAQELAAQRKLPAQLWQEAIRTSRRPPDVILEAQRLLGGYFLQYGAEDAGWKGGTIVGVEEYLSVVQAHSASGKSGKPPFHYSTRYDLIARLLLPGCDEPETVLVDHKTSAARVKDPAMFTRLAHTNSQFLGHAWLWRYRTGDIVPVMVNVITKTQVPEYTRIVIRFTASELDAWGENQARIEAARLPLLDDPEHRPLRNYSACVPGIGSPCWAWDWCHGSDQDRADNFDIITEENYENIIHGQQEGPNQAEISAGEQVQVPAAGLHRKGRRKRRVLEAPVDGAAKGGKVVHRRNDGAKTDLHRQRRRS